MDWDEQDWNDALTNLSSRSPSALRKATRYNPRNLPCPTCHKPNRLTPADVKRRYQCDECARRDEAPMW